MNTYETEWFTLHFSQLFVPIELLVVNNYYCTSAETWRLYHYRHTTADHSWQTDWDRALPAVTLGTYTDCVINPCVCLSVMCVTRYDARGGAAAMRWDVRSAPCATHPRTYRPPYDRSSLIFAHGAHKTSDLSHFGFDAVTFFFFCKSSVMCFF